MVVLALAETAVETAAVTVAEMAAEMAAETAAEMAAETAAVTAAVTTEPAALIEIRPQLENSRRSGAIAPDFFCWGT